MGFLSGVWAWLYCIEFEHLKEDLGNILSHAMVTAQALSLHLFEAGTASTSLLSLSLLLPSQTTLRSTTPLPVVLNWDYH